MKTILPFIVFAKMRFLLFCFCVFLISACDNAGNVAVFNKIVDINANPLAWQNKTVRLSGSAKGLYSLPFVNQNAYELDDSTGTLVIITNKPLPSKLEKLIVLGVVKSTFIFGGYSFGTVVVEAGKI